MPTNEEILKALRTCASRAPCDDCYKTRSEDCELMLMADAAEALEELMEDAE
jgi:hypothetical protein